MRATGRAAVFTEVGRPIELREYPLPAPEPGGILVRTSMCTVCASDVHTWAGHRPGQTPAILGHENLGRVAELGPGVTRDGLGQPLAPGDRVAWTMYANCGRCFYCRVAGLPQKCTDLLKYGHVACEAPPHWNGGFAEYVYLRPGTFVVKVPDELSDEEVTPVNCATSTVACGLDTIGVAPGDTVVVQGTGMLGLCACAMAADRGAGQVITLDLEPARLEVARQFGATHTIAVHGRGPQDVGDEVRDLTQGRGADVAVEVTGNAAAVSTGIDLLRIGGRYVLIGMVSPGARAEVDWWTLVFKSLTVRGVHNYDASHFLQALDFVRRNRDRFPFRSLVTHRLSLEETERALELCRDRVAIRAAVVPGAEE